MIDMESGLQDPILEVVNLTKTYRQNLALINLSITLTAGHVHGLLGPNGSGKSSGLHVIAGLESNYDGIVVIDGNSVDLKATRASIGFAPDDLPLPSALTAREYLRFHDAMRNRNDAGHAETLSEVVGLDLDDGKMIGTFSHGMKRKLQLIVATMHKPALLILDEPFRGLDPKTALVLRELMSAFTASGGSILLATHDMLRAERDCDSVTILDAGRTVASGQPSELVAMSAQARNLEDVFLEFTCPGMAASDVRSRLVNIFNPCQIGRDYFK